MRSIYLVTLAAAGCALTQESRRHDALVSESGRARPADAADRGDDPFRGAAHLDRVALIRAVLDRNPEVAAARAAWRAALARYPEETGIEDPMVSYSVAPLTVRDDRIGQTIEIEQRLPTPGRRALAGDVALAEAEAARGEVATTQLELALMASTMFDDYYLATRALAINAEHAQLIGDLRKAVEIHYTSGHGSAQDAIEAEMEVAHVDHDRIALESRREVAIAGINGLLHRAPDAPLPRAPETLAPPAATEASLATLEDQAMDARPELAASRARVRGGESAIALADKAFFPQVSVMARYDAMWDLPDQRWMLGVTVEIPLQRASRHAGVERAEAEAARARSLTDKTSDQIRVEVARTRRRAEESHHLLHVYDEQLLPLGRARVDAARAGYVGDQNNFDVVIGAERALRAVQLEREEMLADAWRRQAELDRALGRVPVIGGAP
jgi:cobalt-zinc-cadmium efflux system outer membrane protein